MIATQLGRQQRRAVFGVVLLIAANALAFAQLPSPKPTRTAAVRGRVSDASGNAAVDVIVFLEYFTDVSGNAGVTTRGVQTREVRTNGKGEFHFPGLDEGQYTVRAETISGDRTAETHVTLKRNETTTVDLAITSTQSTDPSGARGSSASALKAPEFFDEPQFTVAGVTQASSYGGHGIETIKRASEALVKATGSLGKESADKTTGDAGTKAAAGPEALEAQRTALRARIAAEDQEHNDTARQHQAERQESELEKAELHHQLAQLDETLGDPLEAVHEYQRAEELAPSEAHCFDWATELLTHRALQPATEIFAQGNRHYPQSVRMLLGLGVSWYARRDGQQAAQYFRAASDLAPGDPTPYLFLGKMQGSETVPAEETVAYLARFARGAPDNAWANYYYAVGLWKRAWSAGPVDEATSGQVETLLQLALRLDPRMSVAYLQLGTLYGANQDYGQAISAYQKATDADPELEEAHYRLALAFRRTGNEAGAQKEMQIHEELARKAEETAERERREIQQFVILLRD